MIDFDKFLFLLEGKFENKKQAFSNPSKYAYIRVTHVKLKDNLFYGEQAYNYNLKSPYRQFVLEPILENDQIRILNYKIKNSQYHLGFSNLNELNKTGIELKNGCDVVLKQYDQSFKGGLTGCDCLVDWMGRSTYLQNEIELTETHYYVIDKGFCSTNHHQIWGSKYGRFEFARM